MTSFTDADTGAPAAREKINLCYDFGEDGGILLDPKNASMFLELQPGVPCRVEHAFRLVPSASDHATGAQTMVLYDGDTSGLESGRVYKIGLGDEQNAIVWWRYRTKDDVLDAEGRAGKECVHDTDPSPLPLLLGRAAMFEVVD